MRIHLKITANGESIPFNHQSLLTGTIHKWLGRNELHGDVALFSFSWLTGGKRNGKGLTFPGGTSFFFSAHDPDVVKRLVHGVQDDPILFNGLRVTEMMLQEEPDLSGRSHFEVASPILIKRRENDKVKHVLYSDPLAGHYLKETLLTRMEKVGIDDPSLDVRFDATSPYARRKNVGYNGLSNICSWCPVEITGQPATKLFAWNVGLGNSTGIGLGAIR